MPVSVLEIRRYPVKSMGGEVLARADLDERGVVGDRAYAVVDGDGRFASGKDSTRFRRRDPVFTYAAGTAADASVRVTREGQAWTVGDPGLDAELSAAFGDPVRVLPEQGISHFDDCSVSLVGTATLEWCRRELGVDADPRRMRVNLLLETTEPFEEEEWGDRKLEIGTVGLTVLRRIERCRMVDLAQDGLTTTTRWLTALGRTRETRVGMYADVLGPGTLAVGDDVRLV